MALSGAPHDGYPRILGRRKQVAVQGTIVGMCISFFSFLFYITHAALKIYPYAKCDGPGCRVFRRRVRSEEHTSELQSLMRISYAVFCLKKKTHRKLKKIVFI